MHERSKAIKKAKKINFILYKNYLASRQVQGSDRIYEISQIPKE